MGVPIDNLSLAVGLALVVYVAMALALRLVSSRLARFSQHTATRVDDTLLEVLGGTSQWLVLLVAVLIGLNVLDLPERWAQRVGQLWFIALVLQVALWANRGVRIGLQRQLARHASNGSAQVSAAGTLIAWGLRTLLWTVVLLAMLSNLGVNITAFIASMGVGGIAIALAAQSVLGDLFASVAIAMDKPFEVGDFIVFNSVAGTVEMVGVKTTRIRSLGGEQVVMANTELLKQTVSNYKRLRERRIVFGFRLGYDTTPEQAEEVSAIVRRLVEGSARLRFDRAHLKAFGDEALEYEVVYIVLDPDYGLYMDEQQRINLALMYELRSRGIRFALPARMVQFAPSPEGGLPAQLPVAPAGGPSPA